MSGIPRRFRKQTSVPHVTAVRIATEVGGNLKQPASNCRILRLSLHQSDEGFLYHILCDIGASGKADDIAIQRPRVLPIQAFNVHRYQNAMRTPAAGKNRSGVSLVSTKVDEITGLQLAAAGSH